MIKKLDLCQIPYSTYGSALVIKKMERQYFGFDLEKLVEDGYYMHALYEDDRYRLLFKLSFDGDNAGMTDEYYPQSLTLHKNDDFVHICMPSDNSIRFCGKAKRFELYMSPEAIIKYNAALFIDEHNIGLNVYTRKAVIYTIKGTVDLDAPWGDNESSQYIRVVIHPDAQGEMDFVFEDFRTEFSGKKRTTSFEEDRAACQDRFRDFMAKVPAAGDTLWQEMMERAYYVLWNNVLHDNQLIRHDLVLASKNWMCCCWNMANMFSMRALMPTHPGLAWEQYIAFVEQQDKSGGVPDWIASYKINNAFVKPPVDGVLFLDMMHENLLSEEQLRIILDSMTRLVGFWMNYRDYDGDGIPEYCHGNDSCADNCTVFDLAPNVEAPDLCAYLALDMECLSEISDQLGDAETAATWRRREQELIERMIEHSYDASKGQFVSRISGTHVVADGDCVINYLPILLGNRLPKEIIDSLVNGLRRENRFLTPYGVASESVSSAKYAPDSYWRGPVWAPWTYFIAKGLREVGEGELAMEIVLNYMNNLRNTGFYENHNALTGAGQRDSILDWTAAVFLIMLRDFMGR